TVPLARDMRFRRSPVLAAGALPVWGRSWKWMSSSPAARRAGSQTRCRKFRRSGAPSGLVNTKASSSGFTSQAMCCRTTGMTEPVARPHPCPPRTWAARGDELAAAHLSHLPNDTDGAHFQIDVITTRKAFRRTKQLGDLRNAEKPFHRRNRGPGHHAALAVAETSPARASRDRCLDRAILPAAGGPGSKRRARTAGTRATARHDPCRNRLRRP